MGGFRGLNTYRQAASLADELREAVREWPLFDQRTVGTQLVRAADSIGANIAEARGRGTPADRCRLLLIARGSALELQHWIERAEQRNLTRPGNAMARAEEVGKLLNGLIRSWGWRPNA